ncbi:hypothetical protein HWV62_17545 [Athelia sp. TMB]|nr:hypothetical protein HWV62_17545 [Athelia sp. TMB]
MAPLWQTAFVLGCSAVVVARLSNTLPEDPYAFPKYRVTYLNGLPVLKDTAERWLRDGLKGGEAEFLDNDWRASLKGIGSGGQEVHSDDQPEDAQLNVTLQRMKMGGGSEYLCLIPPSLDPPAQAPEEPEEEVTPVQSWSLLQPLSGKCLYHRQQWFTYSYCHNQEIRQFRELPRNALAPGASHEPQEDPEWESYTLGRAPPTIEPGVELTLAQQDVVAANLELAKGAGSRYLVQRWSDGTLCDKTGKRREVEVQFHCSMTSTDTIMLVREAKTCSYVLVIHTPRLCGEPGFKSRLESPDEAFIRCREVVNSVDSSPNPDGVREADFPINSGPLRKPLLTVPAAPAADRKAVKPEANEKAKAYHDRLRKTLNALMGASHEDQFPRVIVEKVDLGNGNDDMIFEIDLGEDYGGEDSLDILEALRAAGIDVLDRDNEQEKEEKDLRRDEL